MLPARRNQRLRFFGPIQRVPQWRPVNAAHRVHSCVVHAASFRDSCAMIHPERCRTMPRSSTKEQRFLGSFLPAKYASNIRHNKDAQASPENTAPKHESDPDLKKLRAGG